jgi:hypothetical protein
MARTPLPYSPAVMNGSLADPAGTALPLGVGNGGQIAAAVPERTFLRVVGTTAGNVTVKAGTQPLAIASGQGDLTVAVGTSATVWVGPIESGRFIQSDGSIIIEGTQIFTVTAFTIPRH